jgi:hypothetical protein
MIHDCRSHSSWFPSLKSFTWPGCLFCFESNSAEFPYDQMDDTNKHTHDTTTALLSRILLRRLGLFGRGRSRLAGDRLTQLPDSVGVPSSSGPRRPLLAVWQRRNRIIRPPPSHHVPPLIPSAATVCTSTQITNVLVLTICSIICH